MGLIGGSGVSFDGEGFKVMQYTERCSMQLVLQSL